MVRFACPSAELRMAGGVAHLRSLQPLALQVVNSLFLATTLRARPGGARDLEMIAERDFTCWL